MHCKFNVEFFQLIQFSKAVENELKTTVIQAKEVAPGKYGKLILKWFFYPKIVDLQKYIFGLRQLSLIICHIKTCQHEESSCFTITGVPSRLL